jgi:acetyl-CoA carboxylase biotin carboxylase subunit
MFNKILIANRGEIAVRIIRTCQEMGIHCVAVYSTADRGAAHVRMANESVCVGPPQTSESYLYIPNIIAAAEITGADAIHPGYGLLSENANFAEICRECNITFIGPDPKAIDAMGNKSQARRTAAANGFPILEGSNGALRDVVEAQRTAERVGFPVILKAAAGGGGKGMRIVTAASELERLFTTAAMEAKSAFGDGSIYLERYVAQPRHIEVQVLADNEGNVIHLGERECSVQRRHQKLIEESPSPIVSDKDRKLIGAQACRLAAAVEYRSAGTVETLRDERGRFTFMEMNTRLQVEHPLTEMICGLDLVREQIRIASGRRISVRGKDVVLRGHAIEFRINAEDPTANFAPSPGEITRWQVPLGPGVRVDSMAEPGTEILPYYDSLVAKLVVWAPTRQEAIARARRALDEFRIEGIRTTLDFHRQAVRDARFAAGEYDTSFVDRLLQG